MADLHLGAVQSGEVGVVLVGGPLLHLHQRGVQAGRVLLRIHKLPRGAGGRARQGLRAQF
eukprot:5401609-Pyramimonas_sp.AAC.1